MTKSFLNEGAVAVITGAASGIGRAAAVAFAGRGMKVVMVDADGDMLADAVERVSGIAGEDNVMNRVIDVSDVHAMTDLADAVFDRFGQVDLLMNNAAMRVAGGSDESLHEWRRTMDVNFWAAVYAERAFLPRMQDRGAEGAIVNTGSKQGITNPPGNLVYNVTKSALKSYTEGLQHILRNTEGCKISAHLLVPGFTTTGTRTHKSEAWLPEQVVDRMIGALEADDFYIICEDGEVTAEMDAKRMRWAAGDMIENRPALSRWHPDWAEAFNAAD